MIRAKFPGPLSFGWGHRNWHRLKALNIFAAELQAELFGNVEPFLNSYIPVVITGSPQPGEVARGVTEGIRSRLLERPSC